MTDEMKKGIWEYMTTLDQKGKDFVYESIRNMNIQGSCIEEKIQMLLIIWDDH